MKWITHDPTAVLFYEADVPVVYVVANDADLEQVALRVLTIRTRGPHRYYEGRDLNLAEKLGRAKDGPGAVRFLLNRRLFPHEAMLLVEAKRVVS